MEKKSREEYLKNKEWLEKKKKEEKEKEKKERERKLQEHKDELKMIAEYQLEDDDFLEFKKTKK